MLVLAELAAASAQGLRRLASSCLERLWPAAHSSYRRGPDCSYPACPEVMLRHAAFPQQITSWRSQMTIGA